VIHCLVVVEAVVDRPFDTFENPIGIAVVWVKPVEEYGKRPPRL
jgi:hypothetical protein